MLRGVAKAGGDDPQEDHYGIVVALSNLSKTLSGTEADSTFAAAADAGAALLHVPQVLVMLKDDNGRLSLGGSFGVSGTDIAVLDAGRALAQNALLASGPVIIPSRLPSLDEVTAKLNNCKVESALCVPMRVGETNVGAIVALSSVAQLFSQADIDLLHVVASQTALAAWKSKNVSPNDSVLEDQNALIRLADRKIQELSLVNKVSEAVSSTLNLEQLLDIALEQSLAAVGADAGSLMLISKETNKLEIVASRGLAKKFVKKTSQQVGKGIAGWVAENGESALINDARKDGRFKMNSYRDNINSAAAVPLKVKGEVIGVLNVNTVRPDRVFDERDLQILGTVANQMAVAIENARLYERVNRRTKHLDSLLHVSRTITSTLDLESVMRQLCEEVCALFGMDACVLLLLDDLSERFRFGYGIGLKTRRKYIYYDLAAPLAARVKKTGAKLLVKNLNASSGLRTEISKAEGFSSALCVPIKHQGRLIAVVAGFSAESKTLARSQQEIIRPLGDLAAVAIHNARMYRQKYKLAAILQDKLTPSAIPEHPGLDIGHKFLPARGVGGDYYDFISSGSGSLGIIVGDVAGSGVEAAEYTTMGKYVLRTYAREYPGPADVLAKTNDLVCEDSRTEMFISLFYGVVDTQQGKLRYATAGCEPALLYKASDNSVRLLTADGMLLGIRCGTDYTEQEVDLEPGDVLLVHTDGLSEASVGSSRFGSKAIQDTLRKNGNKTAQGIVDSMYDALMEFTHGRVTDDVAMVAVKFVR